MRQQAAQLQGGGGGGGTPPPPPPTMTDVVNDLHEPGGSVIGTADSAASD